MNAGLNKCHKASPRLSHKLHHHFWREIRRIKVIKCPPNSSPHPNLKDIPEYRRLPKLSVVLVACISGHKCDFEAPKRRTLPVVTLRSVVDTIVDNLFPSTSALKEA